MAFNSGVISTDGLTEIFRTLWKQKRHGVLELVGPHGQLRLTCDRGSIIAAERVEEPLSKSILERLAQNELIDQSLANELQEATDALDSVYRLLVDEDHIAKEDFLKAKHASEYDILYSLRYIHSGSYHFDTQVSAIDDEFSINVQPRTLLLELAELSTENEVNSVCENQASEIGLFVTEPPSVDSLSAEEQELLQVVNAERSLSEVYAQTLLNEYQFRQVVQALLERGVIAFTQVSEPSAVSGPVDAKSTDESAPTRVNNTAVKPTSAIPTTPSSSDAKEQTQPHEAQEAISEPEFVPPWAADQPAVGGENTQVKQRYNWARVEVVEKASALCTLVFLAALAYLVPQIITDFFEALSILASSS